MQADRVVRSTCPYCGVGCQVDLSVAGNRIFRVEAPFDAAPNFGRLCVKGRFGTDYVHHPGRLRAPLIRREPQQPGRRAPAAGPDDWRAASWDEALELVATRLLALRARYGPDCITANACAKASNEDNYLLQKYIRAVIGTNNVDHCTRLCHAASVVALQLAIGSSAMTNAIAEMPNLECFIITGSNTAENHPVIATFLKQAVRRQGATLIVIDPRETEMTRFATLWLRQRPGTDVALFTAMAHVIVEEGLHNPSFIEARTEGFADYLHSLEEATPEWAEEISGVAAEDIRAAARLYARAGAAAIYWGMGISQSSHGTDNALALINLALLCGQIGRPGSGLNPLRGQNNVQGCSDVGGIPGFYTAYQPVSDPDVRQRFERAWQVPLPATIGLTTTEMVDEILSGRVRAWYVMGENPLMSEPNLNHARHALQQLEFFVAQDIFFNESNVYADVILPAAAFAEKDGTYTNSDRRIQRGRTAIDPPGEARADWQIVAELARRTLALEGRDASGWRYPDAEAIWEELRQLTPDFAGISYARLEREGGVHWPCPAPEHPGSPFLFAEEFPRGPGKFWPVAYSQTSEQPDAEFPLTLNTGRVLYHWHGGTMTRASALDQIWPECTVELHPRDAARLGLETGDWVEVSSRRGKLTARLLVTGRSPEGVVFIPFHFAEAAANVLTNGLLDVRAKIPDYKVCSVRVARAAVPPGRPGTELPLTDRGAIKDPLAR
jgi:formate dehydrogenase alpha subunit